ncbi:MAG: hypothetical protein QOJ14_2158 [Thermoleophilaceae bacterium]|jgi:hypothetical protein|nr:hypothetical protein [Thermoleophilaceae bacterium]
MEPVPPQRMPLFRRGRPLKRWRYIGAYAEDVMACVCDVRIGPARQRFWAVAERGRPIVTRTTTGAGGVRIEGSRATVERDGVRIELEVEESGGIETVHPNGRSGYVWTRKQAGVPVRGEILVGGRTHTIDALGAVDDTAGYHERHTVWRWVAGAGRLTDGRTVGWNLVAGVNDAPEGSERAVWVDGTPFEPGPVEIAEDLSRVGFAEGDVLEFDPWSERAERTNRLLVRSAYRQPFGEFSGTLPGGLELAEGRGVMEWHDVRW